VYAVVRSGGKQHKVAVGDELDVERLPGAAGASLTLPALLVVDGATVTTDAQQLAGVSVTAEVVGPVKGPKIRIHKFKNKTGQHTRMGHRQGYTRLRVTGIDTGSETGIDTGSETGIDTGSRPGIEPGTATSSETSSLTSNETEA